MKVRELLKALEGVDPELEVQIPSSGSSFFPWTEAEDAGVDSDAIGIFTKNPVTVQVFRIYGTDS